LRYNLDRLEIAKILSIFSFSIILFCLYIVAHNPGVQGYEISLYDEYPAHFWHLIILSILICQIVLFINIFSENASTISWKAASIGIVLSNSILLLIPLIRRYAIYGSGDPSSHMGYMLDMMKTGYIGHNTYPIAHILGVISHYICGFGLDISMLLYPCIFYIFFILSFYLLHKVVLDCKISILIGLMLAPLLFAKHGNVSFSPQAFSNYYSIILLYLFFIRSDTLYKNTSNYALLIVIAAILITFFHPLTSIFLIFTFSIYEISYRANNRFSLFSSSNIRSASYLTLIMIIIFFIWQSYARILLGTFKRVIAWLNEEAAGTSAFESYSQQISEFQPDLTYLLSSFIYVYGLWLIYMLMCAISILIILNAWRNRRLRINLYLLTFSVGFIICSASYIVSQFLVTGTGYVRVGHYAVVFSLLLIPMAMGHLIKIYKNNARSLKLILVSFFLLTSCITYLTVYSVYLSPITKSSGQQVTDSQLVGMDTFFKVRSEELQVMEGGISASRLEDALYGRSTRLTNVVYRTTPSIPDHFNYTSILYLGDYYEDPVYVVIGKYIRIVYPNLIPDYPERWRFNQTDFFMLENDRSVSKIYSNREIDIYLLNPISKKGEYA